MTSRLETRAVPGSVLVITRPGIAAPGSINATAQLEDAGLAVGLRIRVDPGGTVRVIELRVTPLAAAVRVVERADGEGTVPPGAVTSRALRGIRIDELARAALRQQERPVVERGDLGAGVLQLPGDPCHRTWYTGAPRPPRAELVTDAARAYAEAVTAGSRSPTMAVANALGCSRSQASRLIRQARDGGELTSAGVRRATG
jgi:hypothetical protein